MTSPFADWWPLRKTDPELDIPPFPPLEKVEIDPLEQSCIDRLKRENAELKATIRSLRSSLGNRAKAIKRLKGG